MTIRKNNAKPFARSERATARKAVAFIISVSLVFASFSISSYAAAGTEVAWQAFWWVIRDFFTSETSTFISSALYDAVDTTVGAYENLQTVIDDTNDSIFNLAQAEEPVQFWVSDDGLNYGWQVNSDVTLSSSELEAAEYMVDYLNASGFNSVIASTIKNDGYMAVGDYETAKKLAANAYTSYLESNIKSAGYSFTSGDALASTGSLPTYSFDFVGPKQGLTLPTSTGSVSLSVDGYVFTPPVAHPSRYYSKKWVDSMGYSGGLSVNDDYYLTCFDPTYIDCYSGSEYVIFNGDIYYHVLYTSNDHVYSRWFGYNNFYSYYTGEYDGSSLDLYKSSSGVCLSYVATASDIPSFYIGCCYTDKYTGASYPGQETIINTDDFTTVTGGGEIDIPLTDAEQAVSDALAAGLLTGDSSLAIDESGNIVSADGIVIGKLSDIVDALKSGTLEFEDIQSYLQTISQLVQNGNLTAQQQKALLDNVNTKVADISGDISKINENIASIAEALEIDETQNLDFKTPSTTIIDKFPFSIPFDFYNVITLLAETPKEPIFHFDINTYMDVGGINQRICESIELDLTVFKYNGYDMVRIITNATSIILFSLCLISGTKKLIWK